MSSPLSPECLRDTRLFFLTDSGKEFLAHLESRRPSISPDPNVHTFAFNAGRPAGYDIILNIIQETLEYKKPSKEPKPDSIND